MAATPPPGQPVPIIRTADGEERPATIAEFDCHVVDIFGVSRKIFAGKPVPYELEGGYLKLKAER
jgi:hypothetical protein